MAKIVIIGIGVVGSALARYLDAFGNDVIKNDIKIEDGIENDLSKCLGEEDYIFVCVPTPSNPDGSVDLTYVEKVTYQIGRFAKDKKYSPNVIYKSTMVPGSTAKMEEIFDAYSVKHNIAYNPEFLRQKFAFAETMSPSRIVVGSPNKGFAEKVMELYEETDSPKFIFESYEEAELLKYYANSYYATRISFFNQMKKYADFLKCDHDKIVKAIVADQSVGVHGSNPTGQPWGGNCLPKDISAIISYGKSNGIDTKLLEDVVRVNKHMSNEKTNAKIDNWVK